MCTTSILLWLALTMQYQQHFFHFISGIFVASSVFTITAMALDRYLAITRPFGFFSRCFNKKTTLFIIVGLWAFSMVLFIPVFNATDVQVEEFSLPHQNLTIERCKENWESSFIPQHTFGIICFTAMFAVPGKIKNYVHYVYLVVKCSQIL